MEIITKSAQETQKLGEKIGFDLKEGNLKNRIFCLYGDLGSGKTTFIQGLAKGLGIKKRITSPTFVFIRKYSLEKNKGNLTSLFHIDLYRIENIKETQGLGLEEMIKDKQALVVIEWPEKVKEILPTEKQEICFSYDSENQRKINFFDN